MTPNLSTPLTLPCGAILPNRVAKSAMSERLAAPGGVPSEELVRLYGRWARGGTGLIVTGNIMIDGRAIAESGNVVIQDDRNLGALQAWSRAARSGGAHAWVQINHPGRQVPRHLRSELVAPSAVGLRGTGGAFGRPRALTEQEILAIIERFGHVASVVQRAGFTGVQVHAAHGYLVSQFLSPRTNLREDAWGGTAEKRRRFLLEVVRAVRRSVGPAFPVGVKLNSADFQRGGFDEDESAQVVGALEGEGIDLLEISGGTYESAVMFAESVGESTRKREAFFLEYAEKIRARTKVPVMVTGGFRTAAGMNAALASRAVDVVGLARPLAVEPDLPARLLSGSATAARPLRFATGLKRLDALLQAGFYQEQIRRMGVGKDPDVGLSRVSAFIGYVRPRSAVHAHPGAPARQGNAVLERFRQEAHP